MALAAIVKEETYTGLSEEIQKEYTKQDDGTYLLDVTAVDDFALENVKGLKSALSSERTAREAAETKLKAFDDLDVAKAREALTKVEEMANWKPEDKVQEQIHAITTQLTEKHKTELRKKDQANSTLIKQLEKVMIEAEAVKAITENKGSSTLLLPHVLNATRMRQNDQGGFVVEVVGEDGNPRISPATGSTAPMLIAELVAEMKNQDTFAPAFEGSGATGSGATGSDIKPKIKGGTIQIQEGDQEAIEDNIEELASGKAVIV